jgi:phytol kinase
MFSSSLAQDLIATLITFLVAIAWLRSMNFLAYQGFIEQTLSRKIIHIGTGPLFVLCWLLFSEATIARYLAALVPLAITLQFLAVGLGWVQDPAAVQAMSRQGQAAELLRGPLYYGIAFVVCTIAFWRHSPVGILALMIMCGGDGLADVIGRRWGKHKLPFNANKSWVGSLAMGLGSFGFGYGFLFLFNALGYFYPMLDSWQTVGLVSAIATVATIVEALPVKDIDNLTLTGVAIALGLWLLA